jgi:Tat protein secretion system quality control protein TatD with DNase activity
MATHFSQESLLKASCRLADKLMLPLVVHVAPDGDSLDKLLEVLRGEGWTTDSDSAIEAASTGARRVLLHDAVTACGGDLEKLCLALQAGLYCIVSASGLTEGDAIVRQKANQIIGQIPLDRLLVCSDSPWKTPQSIPDAYIRSQRNEPSNLSFTLQAVHASSRAAELPFEMFTEQIQSNCFTVFGLEFLSAEQVHSVLDLDSKIHIDGSSAKQIAGGIGGGGASKLKSATAAYLKSGVTLLEETDISSPIEFNEKLELLQESKEYFGCPKCRNRLFCPADVTTHSLDAAKSTIFKVGEEGLCQAVIFVCGESENGTTYFFNRNEYRK